MKSAAAQVPCANAAKIPRAASASLTIAANTKDVRRSGYAGKNQTKRQQCRPNLFFLRQRKFGCAFASEAKSSGEATGCIVDEPWNQVRAFHSTVLFRLGNVGWQ